MCLLLIVAGVTLSGSRVYYTLSRPPVYTSFAVIIGLGFLWALISARKKPEADNTKIVPEDLKRSG